VVTIIRLIKDGKVIEETDDLHKMHELLIINDKDVKEIVVSVAKYR
jgi:hypothetical protein|tara:strand:- start:464 stop:601 length:138 start_codon:yes stop_codon:yes gene_type:complete